MNAPPTLGYPPSVSLPGAYLREVAPPDCLTQDLNLVVFRETIVANALS